MIALPTAVRDAILEHAREGYPHEVCGVLLGHAHGVAPEERREVVLARRARNANGDRPRDRFALDPRDVNAADVLARESGLELVGFYHSHPDRDARASQSDLDGTSPWGGFSYPIVSVRPGSADLRSWAREGDLWVEESVELTCGRE